MSPNVYEPTAADAAALICAVAGVGTVRRLDAVHAALRAAYSAGRAAERREAHRIAERAAEDFAEQARHLAAQHADAFAESVARRGEELNELEGLPWPERVGLAG